ncbi:MAG: TRAP transporter substrate-binding protein [Deltaproteobacteria bacterium]|nr:TRAP transporter substrate-binding protein [Deltaproteobacteria bacterium]MBW2340440.1 TRAP transporter substrate-binding protein [Deltaproteobacteria bacterium]
MKKKGLLSLLFVLCFFVSLTIVSVPAIEAKTINLTYSNFFPPTHGHAIQGANMIKEIEKRTNGRVKISYFPGGTLTKPRVCYDGVVKGISDIGMSCFAYTRGKFPVMEAVDLPFGYKSGKVATRVAWAYYKRMRPKELRDVKVLVIHAHGPGILAARKDVNSLDDIKGMKIRCTGLSSKIAKYLGAAPVAMPQNQAYEALQKGVVEGTFCPIEVLKGWKQGEVIDYVIETKALGYTTAMFVVMNKKKYESLPPDIQRVFDEVGEEWVNVHGDVWDSADRAGLKFVIELGKKIHGLSPAQEKLWLQSISPIIIEYQAKMKKKGLPAKKAVKVLRELIAKYQ